MYDDKIRPPQYQCHIGEGSDPRYSFWRDKMGNATMNSWTPGTTPIVLRKLNLKELKKIRNWLDKLIQWIERP